VGFDRGLIGPDFESEEPAGLLAVFEQRSVLAAALLPDAGDELDRELALVFPGFSAEGAHGLWLRVATERGFLVAGVAGISRCSQPCASLIR
jgi:hypothetical protein